MADSSRGRGKKVMAPRGKGRRSQSEREQISQQEKERNKEREAQYARDQARLAHQRAHEDRQRNRGRARGRGGFMGDSRPISGPFSAGSAISADIGRGKAFPKPWAPSSSIRKLPLPGVTGDVKHVKSEDGASRVRRDGVDTLMLDSDVKREVQDGGYISSDPDEAEEGKRRNIDEINLISDDEDDGGHETTINAPPKPRLNSPSMAPIRLQRREHRDRAPPINPESGTAGIVIKQQEDDGDITMSNVPMSSVKQGKQPEKDIEVTGERSFRGVYADPESPVTVKDEPVEDIEEAATATATATSATEKPEDISDVKPKRIHKLGPKHATPVLNTLEDHAEYNRYQDDLQALIHELRHTTVNEETGEDTTEDHKKERVYLFQFPPVVSDLVPQKPIIVKDEPTDVLPDADTSTAATIGTTIAPADNISAAPIKIEEDVHDPSKRPAHLPKLTSGNAGKMRLHKSGKVTLNWGGTSLEVSKGMDVGFLQDIVLVRTPEEQARAGSVGGDAMAFGQVRGKFVVKADLDEILGG